ncbi:MAG: RNA-binding protein [Methylococcaceae bacterium]|nr:RNA-binding protein [Methylococcaceae bacterium]
MLIIIKNIPLGLSKPILEDLLKTTVADTFWFGKGRVMDVHMVQAENRRGKVIEYHCVAMIEPEAAAKRVIRILTGRLIFGVRLKVSEYVVRSWCNDRRQAGKYLHLAREKRVRDRRRHLRINSRYS